MRCPDLSDLPPPGARTGWPWDQPGLCLPEAHPGGRPWPRISLVMPCLNAGAYIEEALRAVLLQGYPDMELIVCDGGSTDGTVDTIRRYERWLTSWTSGKDKGQSHAINAGLAKTTGELFNWVNADDMLAPNAMATLAGLYLANPGCVGVFGAMEAFDEDGTRHVWRTFGGGKQEIGLWGWAAFLPQPAALFKCGVCKDIGGINEKLHYVMDIELILRLADRGPFAVDNKPVYRFRRHAGSKTIRGEMAGMVELIAAEFELGMPEVAERWLKWRMEGHARSAIGALKDDEIARMVDGWSYAKVARYLGRRLRRNIALRFAPGRRRTGGEAGPGGAS